jgi:hypothetical protein
MEQQLQSHTCFVTTLSINFGFHSFPVAAVKRFFASNNFATSASMVAFKKV